MDCRRATVSSAPKPKSHTSSWQKPPYGSAEYQEAQRLGHISPQEATADEQARFADTVTRLRHKTERRSNEAGPKPHSWKKPPFGSPEYNAAISAGWISWEEAATDEQAYVVKRDRAASTTWQRKRTSRQERPSPIKNGQFSQKMSTEAARNQRLTPNAKALLQIINAYCGRRCVWFVTKTFLANSMGVHPRSIQRYLADLEREGYLHIDIDQSTYHGMVKGLVIRLAQKVLPRWLHTWWVENVGNLDRTKLSLNNPQKGISIIKYSREEWRFRCTNPVRFLT